MILMLAGLPFYSPSSHFDVEERSLIDWGFFFAEKYDAAPRVERWRNLLNAACGENGTVVRSSSFLKTTALCDVETVLSLSAWNSQLMSSWGGDSITANKSDTTDVIYVCMSVEKWCLQLVGLGRHITPAHRSDWLRHNLCTHCTQ